MNAPHSSLTNPARLAALRELGLLDTPPTGAFDRLTRLAAAVLHAPVALVSLVEDDRQFFLSGIGLPEPWASTRETPLSHSFCQHTVAQAQPLIISDARTHPLVQDNLAIRDLHVIAYADTPLITAEGHVLGALCVIDHHPRTWTDAEMAILTDLAAAVMTEIALRSEITERQRLYHEAQQALAIRDRFIAIAAHDLKSPITALVGYTDLVARRAEQHGTVDAQDLRALRTVVRQATRLAQMIDVLLDFSLIHSGQLTIQRDVLDVGAVLRRLAERMVPTLADHTLRVTLPPRPLMVQGDDVRLEQVVQNLMQNAATYSPAGTTITLTLAAHGPDVVIRVADQGRGIAPEAHAQLFEEFYRGEHAAGERGLGLGLYVVKHLVTLHGGTIGVQSAVGQGSTFTVSLPGWHADDGGA
jgi:signal transduction histidine kinase